MKLNSFIGGLNLKLFFDKINTVLQINTDKNAPKVALKQQPFAKPEKFHDIFAENFKHIRKTLPLIHASMSLYLSNKDIEQILLKRIKVRSSSYLFPLFIFDKELQLDCTIFI